MKNKGFLIAFAFFALMFFLDLYSTMRLGGLIQYLEANPLFEFGGLASIILLNLVFGAGSMFWYYRTKNRKVWFFKNVAFDNRYHILLALVGVSLLRIFVVWNNWQVGNNPPSVEEAQAITQEVKRTGFILIGLTYGITLLPGWVSWQLFKLDHKIKVKK